MRYGVCRANCYATTFFEVACELTDKFFDYEYSDYILWSGNLTSRSYETSLSMNYNRVTRILAHLSKGHWKVGRVKEFLPSVFEILNDNLRNTEPYLEWVSEVLLEEFSLQTHRITSEDYNFMERDFVILYPRGTELNLEEAKRQTSRIQNPYGIISL